MRLRRLIFSRNDPYARVVHRPRPICKRKGGRSTASARSRYPICFASIFGATLKTILDFSGVATNKKEESEAALIEMLHFLSPVEEAVESMGGDDQPHLINGLATHKVSSKQRKLLPECCDPSSKNTWLGRSGLKDVTMGVTAAVLVAHYVMAATGCDAAEVTTNLARCVDSARGLLSEWNASRFAALSMHKAALGAEIRALERARAAARTAEQVARATGSDRLTALQVQLSYMRDAAWPAGIRCNEGADHARIVHHLERGEKIDAPPLSEGPCGMPSIPVLQLLKSVERSALGSEHSSGSGYSSLASSSAASSIGSEDLSLEGAVADTGSVMDHQLVEAVQRMRSVSTLA